VTTARQAEAEFIARWARVVRGASVAVRNQREASVLAIAVQTQILPSPMLVPLMNMPRVNSVFPRTVDRIENGREHGLHTATGALMAGCGS
jgi:hypothetical protein